MRIHEILHSKGFDVITIPPEALVADMLRLLKDNNLGAVVVSDDGRRIRGIVTERDVVRKLVDGPDFLDSPVSSIMSSDVLTCKRTTRSSPDDDHDQPADPAPARRRRRRRASPGSSASATSKSHITQIEFERDQLKATSAASPRAAPRPLQERTSTSTSRCAGCNRRNAKVADVHVAPTASRNGSRRIYKLITTCLQLIMWPEIPWATSS
jgi:hypothetical protein